MLPACFSTLSAHCERGPRSLLIVSSDRELEVNGRSLSIARLYRTADFRPAGTRLVRIADTVAQLEAILY
jgi:glycogen debranching enzyme